MRSASCIKKGHLVPCPECGTAMKAPAKAEHCVKCKGKATREGAQKKKEEKEEEERSKQAEKEVAKQQESRRERTKPRHRDKDSAT